MKFYFTTGLNNEANSMDTCGNFVETDAEAIKAEFGVDGFTDFETWDKGNLPPF